jgi:uncharacterized surface protein with fasciclin (FAS1) repeats
MKTRSITATALAALLTLPALASAQSKEKSVQKDIVQIAVENGGFTTLVAALKAAGLVGTLQGSGPFTVFAPTDAAFAKLPPGTVEALLKDKEKLTAILTYHVLSGKVMSKDISGRVEPATVNGATLTVERRSNGVFVDNAQVVTADIVASNGVIHVIDAVVLPKPQPAASR